MRSRAIALSVLAGFGCASKPPSAAPLAQAPTASAPLQAESPVDLSPVAAPDDLIAIGRLARPRAFVETLASWSGFPLHLADVLPSEAQVLNQVVSWDAPVEAVAVIDRHSSEKVAPPEYVVSVGLLSVDSALRAAKDKGFEVTRVSTQVYRVPLAEDVSCAVAAAAGSAPARLVCSEKWQSVEDLLPYATRGLPREDFGGRDLYLALKPAPLQARYGQEISSLPLFVGIGLRQVQTDSPRLDRALADAAYGIAGELKTLALSLNGFDISARIDDRAKSLDFGYSFGFAKDESFTAQLLQDSGHRSSVPNETFWDLPRTASSGQFTTGFDPKRLAALFGPLGEITDAFLEQRKAPPTYRSRFRSVFDSLPIAFSGAARVSGSTPPAKELTAQSLFASNLGWHVGVQEVRADRLYKLMTDLEALLADRETPKLIKELLPKENPALPKVRHKVVKVAGFPARGTAFIGEIPYSLVEKMVEKSALAASVKDAKKDAKKPVSVVVVLVPDGERTYYSIAADERSAISVLEGARAGRDGKLSENPELARLKERPSMGVGFSSLEALFGPFSALARAVKFDAQGALSLAPNHGRSAWITRVEHLPLQNGGLRVSATISVPQGAFQDVAGIAPALISAFASHGAGKSDSSRSATIR
ncbi:MAG TPA: hypothetical protein VFQ35_25390 [Polyangiaceae bacterium]|nr:hypothetical protein [Polyangiaceae bacterium]